MSEIDDRWRTGLQAEAVTIELADTGSPERVVRRARRRSARRRGAVGVVTSGLVVASGLAWQADRASQRDRAQDLVVSNEPDGGAADGGADDRAVPTTTAGGWFAYDPSSLPDVPLDGAAPSWNAEDVPWGKGLAYAYWTGVRGGNGSLVSVSTSPGVSTNDGMSSALYTSTDGITWNGTELKGSHWFGDVTSVDGRLVAVGTAAATGKIDTGGGWAVGDVVVALSDDEGRSWRDVVLPVDLRGAAAQLKAKSPDGGLSVTSAKVAHGAKGWLVAVAVRASVDGRGLLPAGVDASAGYVTTYDGVAVYARETDPDRAALQACMFGGGGCDATAADRAQRSLPAGTVYTPKVAHLYTWAELGFDAEMTELLHGTVRLFASTDGERFTAVAAPEGVGTALPPGSAALVTPTTDGFALAMRDDGCCTVEQMSRGGNPSGRVLVWRTTDVSTWQALEPVELGDGFGTGTFGEVAGRLVLVGSENQLPVVAVAEGTSWRVSKLGRPLLKAGEQVVSVQGAVGEGGVAVATATIADPWAGGDLTVTDNGYTLRVEGTQRGISIVDDSGTEVIRIPDLYVGLSNGRYTVRPQAADVPADGGGLSVATTAAGPVAPPATALATVPYRPTTTLLGPVVGGVGAASTVAGVTASSPVPTPAPTTTSTMLLGPSAGGAGRYEVQLGDIAVKIAERAGVSFEQLQAANPGTDLNEIVPGQVLTLPGTALTDVPPPQAAPGAGALVLTDDTTGATLASFDVAELQQRLQQLAASNDISKVRSRLLVSRDGLSWSLVDLAEAAGTRSASVQNLVVTADRVLATVATDETDPDAPKPPYDGMPPFRTTKVVVGRFA